MYFNYVIHRDYKAHSLCFMGIATFLLLYYYNTRPPSWNVFQYWLIANGIGGILHMLLLVKINGRIDMFFVKRKTSALPLLHLSSYHIIISCHAYACWCDEHQCVEHNVFGAPNFFSLFKKIVAPQAFYGSRAMLRFVNVHSHFIIIEFHITRLHAGIHWNFIKLKHLHHW